MSKLTFSNKQETITATINDGAIAFDNGKTYTLSKRFNADGISGIYISDGGKTFSLEKVDFIANRADVIEIANNQPKREKSATASDRPRKKAATDFNTFRIATASAERIASIFIGVISTTADNLKNAGATTDGIIEAIGLTATALTDENESAKIIATANAEIAALMQEEKRKADEARKAQAKAKIAQLKALGLTADELVDLLK